MYMFDVIIMESKDLKTGLKRKHVTLTIINKLKVIEQLEKGTSGKKIAEIFGISRQTVSDIKKQKTAIKAFASKFDVEDDKSSVSSRQTLKKPKEVFLEEAVYKWYTQQRSMNLNVSGAQLKAAAENFAKHLELHNFTCSSGWMWRFRQRHNITKKKNYDETLGTSFAGFEQLSKETEEFEPESFQTMFGESEETETPQELVQNWVELDGYPQPHALKKEPVEDTNDYNMETRLDLQLDGTDPPKESITKKELLNSARSGIDAVINYVESSLNQELQVYYEHLRIVRDIIIKEHQQRPF